MTLAQFVRAFWADEVQRTGSTDVRLDAVTEAVLADAELTREAVAFTIKVYRQKYVDRFARARLTETGNTRDNSESSPLVDALIAHGLSLLDTRFGSKRLGDYLPDELADYVSVQRMMGQTILIRAAFANAVALACPDPEKPVRAQLSERAIEAIRERVIRRAPDPETADRLLVSA